MPPLSRRPARTAARACAALLPLLPHAVHAHAIAGARVFPVTINIDDPGIADEASLPTLTYQRSAADDGPGPVQSVDVGWEYDKRITRDIGLAINDDLNILSTEHAKTRLAWADISITAKYQAVVSATHEFIMSVGVIREFARTGTQNSGADQTGFTQPTLYAGKGLGDIPIDALRPFAITGELGYAVADKQLKQLGVPSMPAAAPNAPTAALNFNNGLSNTWSGGLSVQYSIPYLVSQIRDIRAPSFFKHLIPLVEVAWSTPASSPTGGAPEFVVAPGIIWLGSWYQIGLEALIPGNKAAGTNVGVVTQFHIFLDDLLPKTLGKPLFD